MKKGLFLLTAIVSTGFISCETSDTCQCEQSQKIYDDNGQIIGLDYIGSREGRCEDLTDRDDINYQYESVNCS